MKFVLAGVGNDLEDNVEKTLAGHRHTITFDAAKEPVLDTNDHVLWSYFFLGSDVYKKGIYIMGASDVYKFVQKEGLFNRIYS